MKTHTRLGLEWMNHPLDASPPPVLLLLLLSPVPFPSLASAAAASSLWRPPPASVWSVISVAPPTDPVR